MSDWTLLTLSVSSHRTTLLEWKTLTILLWSEVCMQLLRFSLTFPIQPALNVNPQGGRLPWDLKGTDGVGGSTECRMLNMNLIERECMGPLNRHTNWTKKQTNKRLTSNVLLFCPPALILACQYYCSATGNTWAIRNTAAPPFLLICCSSNG